jgi:hypothetical protein
MNHGYTTPPMQNGWSSADAHLDRDGKGTVHLRGTVVNDLRPPMDVPLTIYLLCLPAAAMLYVLLRLLAGYENFTKDRRAA